MCSMFVTCEYVMFLMVDQRNVLTCDAQAYTLGSVDNENKIKEINEQARMWCWSKRLGLQDTSL